MVTQNQQPRIFRQRLYAKTFGIYFLVLTFVAALGLILVRAQETRVGYAIALIAFGILTVRAFRSAEITQTDRDVVVQTILWTYRIRRSDVRRFGVATSPVFGRRRVMLVMEFRDGHTKGFRSFSGLDTGSGREIGSAAEALNENWGLHGQEPYGGLPDV